MKKRDVFLVDEKRAQQLIKDVMDQGALLVLDCGHWGNRKKLDDQYAEEVFGTDKGAISASHKLLASEAWNDVLLPMRQAQSTIRKMSHPWLSNGWYLIMQDKLEVAKDILTKGKAEMFRRFDEEFSPQYADLEQAFKKSFPKLYNAANYPKLEVLRGTLRMRWLLWDIAPPSAGGKLAFLSREERREQDVRWKEQIKQAAELAIVQVRKAFADIIIHMKDVLTDSTKKFKESSIEKPKEFLVKLQDLNIWGDEPFAALAKEAAAILDGVEAGDLRDDDQYRKLIGEAVGAIVDDFKKLPVVEMERSIDF